MAPPISVPPQGGVSLFDRLRELSGRSRKAPASTGLHVWSNFPEADAVCLPKFFGEGAQSIPDRFMLGNVTAPNRLRTATTWSPNDPPARLHGRVPLLLQPFRCAGTRPDRPMPCFSVRRASTPPPLYL